MLDDDRCVEDGRTPYDDMIEFQQFRDFLPTKNGVMVFRLVGHENTESTSELDV